jgi:hypothetical protein
MAEGLEQGGKCASMQVLIRMERGVKAGYSIHSFIPPPVRTFSEPILNERPLYILEWT